MGKEKKSCTHETDAGRLADGPFGEANACAGDSCPAGQAAGGALPAAGVAGPWGRVAVLVPCYNEDVTVEKVVRDFKRELPGCTVYVYDNNSTDATARFAAQAGAVVARESRQGKGNVVRQMLRDIDADCYLMVDGDDTYPAEAARSLVEPVLAGEADTVVGDRLSNGTYGKENKRAFHGLGNDLVRWLIDKLYGFSYTDVMTGYRAFSRQFAKTLPVLSGGFEIETELSIHAVDKRWRICQVPIEYRDRPAGSSSKLDTFRDGARVLKMIFSLFKDYKPLPFFSLLAAVALAAGLALGVPVCLDFARTGAVERFPTAILAGFLCLASCMLMCCGLILDTEVKAARREWELECMRVYGDGKRAQGRAAGSQGTAGARDPATGDGQETPVRREGRAGMGETGGHPARPAGYGASWPETVAAASRGETPSLSRKEGKDRESTEKVNVSASPAAQAKERKPARRDFGKELLALLAEHEGTTYTQWDAAQDMCSRGFRNRKRKDGYPMNVEDRVREEMARLAEQGLVKTNGDFICRVGRG